MKFKTIAGVTLATTIGIGGLQMCLTNLQSISNKVESNNNVILEATEHIEKQDNIIFSLENEVVILNDLLSKSTKSIPTISNVEDEKNPQISLVNKTESELKKVSKPIYMPNIDVKETIIVNNNNEIDFTNDDLNILLDFPLIKEYISKYTTGYLHNDDLDTYKFILGYIKDIEFEESSKVIYLNIVTNHTSPDSPLPNNSNYVIDLSLEEVSEIKDFLQNKNINSETIYIKVDSSLKED